jgi:hypothetical protein
MKLVVAVEDGRCRRVMAGREVADMPVRSAAVFCVCGSRFVNGQKTL